MLIVGVFYWSLARAISIEFKFHTLKQTVFCL